MRLQLELTVEDLKEIVRKHLNEQHNFYGRTLEMEFKDQDYRPFPEVARIKITISDED